MATNSPLPFFKIPIRAATIALGSLRDTVSFAEILALLDDRDARVRRGALRSLQEISGLSLPADSTRWQRWYKSEVQWFQDLSRGVTEVACGPDSAEAVRALQDLSGHRLFGETLTKELVQAMRCTEPEVVRAACAALYRLRAPSAIGLLIEALEHDEEIVRSTALAALNELTGEDHPANAAVWREWLESAR